MGRLDGVLLASDFDNTLLNTETARRTGAEVPEGSLVVLYTEYVEPQDDGLVDVPDLTGLSLVPANRELREVGLTMKIDGSGICVSQDPEPGERVAAGTEVVVTFE